MRSHADSSLPCVIGLLSAAVPCRRSRISPISACRERSRCRTRRTPLFGERSSSTSFGADGLYADQALVYALDPMRAQLRQYHYQLWTDPPTRVPAAPPDRAACAKRMWRARVTDELPASNAADPHPRRDPAFRSRAERLRRIQRGGRAEAARRRGRWQPAHRRLLSCRGAGIGTGDQGDRRCLRRGARHDLRAVLCRPPREARQARMLDDLPWSDSREMGIDVVFPRAARSRRQRRLRTASWPGTR